MQVINRKGELFNVDGDVVPDGCSLRTNIFMLDSGLDDTQREIARSYSQRDQIVDAIGRTAGHRPGFLLMNMSSGRQDAADDRTIRKRQLSDAWHTPMSDALNEQGGAWEPTRTPDLVPFKPEPDADAAGILSAAYLAEKVRVSNAWRSPAGASINPAEPKARVFEKNWAASYAPYEDAADGVDVRDAAFAALVARSESAWRTP
jgi:hypothetical protein